MWSALDAMRRLTQPGAQYLLPFGARSRFLFKMDFAEAEEHFPPGTDARSAVRRLDRETNMPPGWISSRSASCPEAFLRDGSIGFVYVGDGLPTKLPRKNAPLILFCPAESHQRSRQHCHAINADGLHCAKSNAEMIELLRKEQGQDVLA
jgi:hypothetical protein